MNGRLLVAMLLLATVLATAVCQKSEPDVSQLPELPNDIAQSLKRVPNSDLLVSIAPIPAPSPTPARPKPKGPVFLRACMEMQDFIVQVTYPVTVCTQPDIIASAFMAPAPRSTSGLVTTADVRDFKLTAFEGQRFTTPFHCQTHNGPWIATISRTIFCNEATSCVMVILGVPSCPDCPAFLWGGQNCQAENRPPQLNFIDGVFPRGKPTLSACNTQTNCGPDTTPSPVIPQ
jgi:hypothetical protein